LSTANQYVQPSSVAEAEVVNPAGLSFLITSPELGISAPQNGPATTWGARHRIPSSGGGLS